MLFFFLYNIIMSYSNYFNDLRKIDNNVDKHFGGNTTQKERMYRNYVRNHPHFLHLEGETTRSKSNQINNIVGAIDMLNTPNPLPISHYKQQKVNYDTTGVHTSGYKNLHYDIEENEVVHKPNPSITPHSRNNLPHKEGTDALLELLVKQGLAKVYNTSKPITKKDKPKVKGELNSNEYSKLSMDDQLHYDKKMATVYRDTGLGSYRPPILPKPPAPIIVKPTPKPTPTPKPAPKTAPIIVESDLPTPPPPDTSGMVF
jgi:hypothetical protein